MSPYLNKFAPSDKYDTRLYYIEVDHDPSMLNDWLNENIGEANYKFYLQNTIITRIECKDIPTCIMLKTIIEMKRNAD